MARKSVGGAELIERLNEMVAELIKTNRRLKREVDRLTARRPAAARSAVKRSSRTTARRVQRAPKKTVKSKSRKTTAASKAKRKTVTSKRRKTVTSKRRKAR